MTYQIPVQVEGWWIVTLRRVNDDEDCLYMVQAKDWKAAAAQAEREFRDAVGMPARPRTAQGREDELNENDGVYINYVVQCFGKKKPVVFKTSID